jgi:hypothetical protein
MLTGGPDLADLRGHRLPAGKRSQASVVTASESPGKSTRAGWRSVPSQERRQPVSRALGRDSANALTRPRVTDCYVRHERFAFAGDSSPIGGDCRRHRLLSPLFGHAEPRALVAAARLMAQAAAAPVAPEALAAADRPPEVAEAEVAGDPAPAAPAALAVAAAGPAADSPGLLPDPLRRNRSPG